ncbi:MAG: hypothetical protein EYC71_11835 [Gammaproteobacteria bacterium]|nr:MAG: hypothetical protein EYC71_11835 [Gammaproteobacteria bacterium]
MLLLAFFLSQRGTLAEDSRVYLLLNFVGASLAGFAAWLAGVIPFVVLEGVWALVAAWGLMRRWRVARVS